MKKISYFILSALAVFAFSAVAHAANGTAQIVFTSPTPNPKPGNIMIVNVVVDSSVPVNVAQLKIGYPSNIFKFVSIDTAGSQFSIKAQETITPGLITIARGNIQPRSGKNLLATLEFQTLQNGSLSDFIVSPNDSLVMSSDGNENILIGSQVQTVHPPELRPSPTAAAKGFFPKIIKSGNSQSNSGSFTSFLRFIFNFAQGSFHQIITSSPR